MSSSEPDSSWLSERVRVYISNMLETCRDYFVVCGGKNFVEVEYSDDDGGGFLIDSDFDRVVEWIKEMAHIEGTP